MIIVDDGSEDNTVAISDFYAERYSAVQVIHSENQGVSSARNLGMEKAIGDYILFLDADDRLIESALDNMVPYTSEAEWVIGNYVMIEEKSGKRIYNRQFFKENIHVGGQNELFELTEMINEKVPEKLSEKYDYFIAGSDQVWNPYLEYCTEANFLTFAESLQKIAISPSIAIEEIPERNKEDFSKWIRDFRLLSVREEKGAELIRNLCGREAEVLCDPTMYLSAYQWEKIEKKPEKCPEEYVLTYYLGSYDDSYRNWVQTFAKKQNLKIFELQSEEHFGIAPDEFLYLIHHATCVCTDSFHGTVANYLGFAEGTTGSFCLLPAILFLFLFLLMHPAKTKRMTIVGYYSGKASIILYGFHPLVLELICKLMNLPPTVAWCMAVLFLCTITWGWQQRYKLYISMEKR